MVIYFGNIVNPSPYIKMKLTIPAYKGGYNDSERVIIQAFFRKGHSTDRIGTDKRRLRPLLFLSKYLYFCEILIFLLSMGGTAVIKSSCASSQPGLKPRAASVPLLCGCCFSTESIVDGVVASLRDQRFCAWSN